MMASADQDMDSKNSRLVRHPSQTAGYIAPTDLVFQAQNQAFGEPLRHLFWRYLYRDRDQRKISVSRLFPRRPRNTSSVSPPTLPENGSMKNFFIGSAVGEKTKDLR